MKQLYLIDASVYVFRGYFSLPSSMVDSEGNPANAVYGYANFLAQFLTQNKAEYVAAAFDKSLTTSFRNEFYPAYKQNRDLPPPELEAQFESCMAITEAMGITKYVDNAYEADDLIGAVATKMRPQDFQIIILSSDKDLAQLLEGEDILWDYAKDRKLDREGVREFFGVPPEAIVDYLALLGDKVDNIPGVAGIGKKSASILLNELGSLENIYADLGKVETLKIRGVKRVVENLKTHRETAFLSQKLAQIALDAPAECSEDILSRNAVDQNRLNELCEKLKFGEGIRGRLLSA